MRNLPQPVLVAVLVAVLLAVLCAFLPAAAPGDTRFGGDAHFAPSRDFDLQHVAIAITPDLAKHTITGEVRLTMAPLAANRTEVALDAKGGLLVRKASLLGGGGKVTWQHSGEQLLVTLPRAFKKGEAFTLVLAYHCAPPAGVYFRNPDKDYPKRPLQAWTQGEDMDNSNWVPLWDYPNDRATSEMTLTVPADLLTISNGELLDVKEDKKGGTKTWHWKEATPHVTYLISFVVGDFAKVSQKWKDVSLDYYVARGQEAAIPHTFGRTADMMQFFSDLTGVPYPYQKYAQTAVNGFMWGGMENISATTLNGDRLVDPEIKDERIMDGLVAHELAHQWFGDLVTTRDWGHVWLNEGFASFMDMLWEEEARGKDGLDIARYEAYAGYAAEEWSYQRPIVTRVFREASTMFDSHTYGKGALVLFMLRDHLGADRFWPGVREYLKRHALDVVDTHDFIDAMADTTGENLDWFFEQWVFGTGHPRLEASFSWDAKQKELVLEVEQANARGDDAGAPFRLSATIEIWYGATPGGKHERRRVVIDEAKEKIVLAAATRPKLVLIDPDRELIRSLTWDRPAEQAILQLAHPRAAARIEAAEELARGATSKTIVQALARCLAQDKLWSMRQICAGSLGQNGGKGAYEALVKVLSTDKDARVRDTAAAALGGFSHRKEPRAAEALAKALAGDKSPFVRGTAAASLGRTRAPKARALLIAALKEESYRDEVRQGALRGLGSLAEPATLDVVLAHTARGGQPTTRIIALEAAMAIGARLDEPSRDLRDVAMAMLGEDDFQIERGVLSAMGDSGDPDLLAELDRWAEHAPQPRLRIAAEDASLALRASVGDRRTRADVARDVEELKRDNRDLQRRLDDLEKTGTRGK